MPELPTWMNEVLSPDATPQARPATTALPEWMEGVLRQPESTGRIGPQVSRMAQPGVAYGTQDQGQATDWEHLAGYAKKMGFTVTGKNEKSGHNPGSKHYRGMAIDVRTRDKTPEQVEAFIKAAKDAGIKVVDERTRPKGQAVWTGPHLHLEIQDHSAFAPSVQPTAKPQKLAKAPNQADVAQAMVGNPLAALNLIGGTQKPTQKNVQKPKNPNLVPKGLIPKTAQDVFNEQKTPQRQQEIIKKVREEIKKQPIHQGSFKLPGIGDIPYIQRGPGYEANVPGIGKVLGGTPRQLAQNIQKAAQKLMQDVETRKANPNQAAYIASDDNAIPGNVQDPRTSAQQLLGTYGKLNPNARDRRDAFNKQVSEIGDALSTFVSVGSPVQTPLSGLAGQALASVVSAPANIAYEIETIQSPEFTNEEKAGAVLNLAVAALTSSATPLGPSILDEAFKLIKGRPDKFAQALNKLNLEPNQKAAALEYVQKNPGMTFKGFKDGKPVFGGIKATTAFDDTAVDAEIEAFKQQRRAKTQKVGEPPRVNLDEIISEARRRQDLISKGGAPNEQWETIFDGLPVDKLSDREFGKLRDHFSDDFPAMLGADKDLLTDGWLHRGHENKRRQTPNLKAGVKEKPVKSEVVARKPDTPKEVRKTYFHSTQKGVEFDELQPSKDGGFHFGTKAQADMRGSGKQFEVELEFSRPRRSKDTGGDWGSRIKSAKAAGYDAIVYLNRYEGIDKELLFKRLEEGWTGAKLDSISDKEFKKLFPGQEDSVIVFDKRQIRYRPTAQAATSADAPKTRVSEPKVQEVTPTKTPSKNKPTQFDKVEAPKAAPKTPVQDKPVATAKPSEPTSAGASDTSARHGRIPEDAYKPGDRITVDTIYGKQSGTVEKVVPTDWQGYVDYLDVSKVEGASKKGYQKLDNAEYHILFDDGKRDTRNYRDFRGMVSLRKPQTPDVIVTKADAPGLPKSESKVSQSAPVQTKTVSPPKVKTPEKVEPPVQKQPEAVKVDGTNEAVKTVKMYHGGPSGLTELTRLGKSGHDAGGIFFTPNKDYAKQYSKGGLYEADIPLEDIFDAKNPKHIKRLWKGFERLIDEGEYDLQGARQDYDHITKNLDLEDWSIGSQHVEVMEAAGFKGARFKERPGTISLDDAGGFNVSGDQVDSIALFKGPVKVRPASEATSKLASVDAEIAAVKQARSERLKSTTKKGNKQRGSVDITKEDLADAVHLTGLYAKKAVLTFEQYTKEMVEEFGEAIRPHLQKLWNDAKGVRNTGERVKAPQIEAQTAKTAIPDETGIAKQITGRDPKKGITKEELNQLGQEAIAKDANVVSRAVEQTSRTGRVMNEIELAASGVRLRQIANRESAIRGTLEKQPPLPELNALLKEVEGLEAEREAILSATDYSLNRGFHRAGIAAQLVYKPDFSLGMLKAKAKANLMGTVAEIPKEIETKLKFFSAEIDRLNADLEAARKQISDLIKKGSYRRGTKEANVKRLREFFGEQSGTSSPMQSKRTKQAGAIYNLPDEERDAMRAMRSLAKQLAEEGAESLDDIVKGIRNAVGVNVPDETIYSMLSDSYRRHMIEADVQRLNADRYLREIQRAAVFKLTPPLKKAFILANDLLGVTSRSMQAGFDISAPFIQGRKGLVANPVGWMKAWNSQLKALKGGDQVTMKRIAEIQKHPMYSRFVAAGGDKLLRVPGGKFSAQEEAFASNFMRLASEAMDKKGKLGKYNPVNLYLKGLMNSDAAFSAFLNDVTWDTFLRWSKAGPDDPAYLRDSVQNLSIIFGRGHGKLAEAIGRSGAGNVFFAPRYVLSQFQYANTPIRTAYAFETGKGRAQALKLYGTQAAIYASMAALAKLAGWDVDSDLRSSTFGTVAIGGRRVDLFGKEAQAYKLLAQMYGGTINKENKYQRSSILNAAKTGGMFVTNKLAPGPRLPLDVAFGAYDPDKGNVAYSWEEFGKRYLPIWVQQTLENKDMMTIPLAVTGMDISKDKKSELPQKQREKAYPFEGPKIGGKMDALGRDPETKVTPEDKVVMDELKRLQMEVQPLKRTDSMTDQVWKIRTTEQGNDVRQALSDLMKSPGYKNATPTEKREMIKSEISAAKSLFNEDYNEWARNKKEQDMIDAIKREKASGMK